MTNKEIRIAIAEACGWTYNEIIREWVAPNKAPIAGDKTTYGLPNYLNDLNAMHEAVKNLPDALRHTYRVNLCITSNGIHPNNVKKLSKEQQDQAYWQYCNATAAQRAEAFLRTLNLWKD